MGLSGELLGRLSIDPKKGETYAMLEKEMKLGEEDAEGKGVQINLAEQLKQALELSRRYAKPSTSEIAVDTPTPPPSDVAEGFITTPKKNRKHRRIVPVSVGIVGYTLTEEIASHMGLEKETRGALVIDVLENSIAEKAGLRAGTTPAVLDGTKCMLGGDIIIGVEDKTINNMGELTEYLSLYHKQGSQIKFRVLRNRKPIEIALVY
jgi:S1-C subfamily serine protease